MSTHEHDLIRAFKAEVTDRGPKACLPKELSDSWLSAVLESTESILEKGDDSDNCALALAALIALLDGKQQAMGQVTIDLENLIRLMSDYRIELALEMVHRCTEIKYEPATLKTIFSNRDVYTWKEEPPERYA